MVDCLPPGLVWPKATSCSLSGWHRVEG